MNSIPSKTQGSILIWTVFLSLALTTAFFFFSQKLNFNATLQIKSIEQQNAQLFLESYADYVASLSFEELKKLAGEIDYYGITGTLSNSLKQVKGTLDIGQSLTYNSNGPVKVEWNLCSKNEAGRTFTLTSMGPIESTQCKSSYEFFTQTNTNSFTMAAGNAPVSYRITALAEGVIYDQDWLMSLTLSTSAGKAFFLERIITPKNEILDDLQTP